jgi:hypothetical protein
MSIFPFHLTKSKNEPLVFNLKTVKHSQKHSHIVTVKFC